MAVSATLPRFNALGTNDFGLTNLSSIANPSFADIDGDGDLDAFVGSSTGSFYRNTGTSGKPDFPAPGTNSFGLDAVGYGGTPTFADIDGDGDLDAFVGDSYGDTHFFRNTGTAGIPVFTDVGTNRFGLENIGYSSSLTFADIDGDGDLDAFAGSSYGDTLFYRNNGNRAIADFAIAEINPFSLTNAGTMARPSFVDIDGDGDLDAFVGNGYGELLFYRNDTAPRATNLIQDYHLHRGYQCSNRRYCGFGSRAGYFHCYGNYEGRQERTRFVNGQFGPW